MTTTDTFEAFTVSLLANADQYLLLQRSPKKAIAPGLWTGVGGHIESHEFSLLRASALREIQEETGILAEEIQNFALRRAVLINRPNQPIGLLLYYTGVIAWQPAPHCPEGELAWKRVDDFNTLPIIETTGPVLNGLVEDLHHDPTGLERLQIGVARFSATAQFQGILWATGD